MSPAPLTKPHMAPCDISPLDLCNGADLNTLTPLFDAYRVFYKQASNPAQCRAFLRERGERGEATVYLARDPHSGQALGYTLIYPSFSSVSTVPITILNDLYVAPEARCRGVGTALMDRAVLHAREHGAVRLTLTTALSNRTAQSVYEAHGWVRDDIYLTYHRKPALPLNSAP